MPTVSAEQARAAVGSDPVCDPQLPALEDRFEFYLHTRQQGTWPKEVSGHDPSEAEWFADYEALRNVTPSYPPTILLHGEADTDVQFEQSVLMQAALEAAGVRNTFVSRPDWQHGFDHLGLQDEHVSAAFDAILEFLSKSFG